MGCVSQTIHYEIAKTETNLTLLYNQADSTHYKYVLKETNN